MCQPQKRDTVIVARASDLTVDAINAYELRLRDLPQNLAREAAVRDVSRPGHEIGLDVRNYTRSVIDHDQQQSGQRSKVVYEHASGVDDEGRCGIGPAAKIANTALIKYDDLRKEGQSHEVAREQVAKDMGQRFDERGRDSQQQEKQRQRSQGMGL
jgi:hypothetical protein